MENEAYAKTLVIGIYDLSRPFGRGRRDPHDIPQRFIDLGIYQITPCVICGRPFACRADRGRVFVTCAPDCSRHLGDYQVRKARYLSDQHLEVLI